MSDALNGAGAKEGAESDRLAAIAQGIGNSCIQSSTVTVAQYLIKAVAKDSGAGALAEPANDLRMIRSSSPVNSAINRDMANAQDAALHLISGAIQAGYKLGAKTRGVDLGLPVKAEISPADLAALASYPVLGHTAAEIAADLVHSLRYDVDGALAAPLTGQIDADGIPAALGDVAQAHGRRLGNAVGEAFHAGVQAAVRAIGQLLGAA